MNKTQLLSETENHAKERTLFIIETNKDHQIQQLVWYH